jgi:hypothetical protein
MPIIANIMDFNVTGAEAAFICFNQPRVVIEMFDPGAKGHVINLDQKVYVTPPPTRYLSLEEQKTLDVAWASSTKIRQIIKI